MAKDKKDKKDKTSKKERKERRASSSGIEETAISKKSSSSSSSSSSASAAKPKKILFDAAAALAKPSGSVSVVAQPLAEGERAERLLNLTAAGASSKSLRRGVKEVVKALRKGEKGLCVLAGDISPIDVIAHLPVLCEDSKVQYMFVPSKSALGEAACTKRPTSVVLITPPKGDAAVQAQYDALVKEAAKLTPKF